MEEVDNLGVLPVGGVQLISGDFLNVSAVSFVR
jgi:hypothetical protein